METTTKSIPQPRSTGRVTEALATLAALLDRTIKEVQSLDSEFQSRLLQAVHDTEASLQNQAAQHLDTALHELRASLEEHFKNRLVQITEEWEAERQRLNGELERAARSAAEWEAERARLNNQMQRLSQAQAAAQAEAQKAIDAARQAEAKAAASAAASKPVGPAVNGAVLDAEIQRVEAVITQITDLIEDSATELSIVIRKNVERSELESYIKGIRYAMKNASAGPL